MQLVLGILLLIATSAIFGRRLFGTFGGAATVLGGMVYLAIIASIGSVLYYIYAWPLWLRIGLIAATVLWLLWEWRRNSLMLWSVNTLHSGLRIVMAFPPLFKGRRSGATVLRTTITPSFSPLKRGRSRLYREKIQNVCDSRAILFFLAIILAFVVLFQSATTDALSSPWNAIPAYFFIIVFLAVTLGIITVVRRPMRTPLVLGGLLFLFLSVALIVYTIGYGFDPFIHQAAERAIFDHGVIMPKSPYYIGQYVLVTFLTTLSGTTVPMIDRLLVPVLAALVIPAALLVWTRKTAFPRPALLAALLAAPVFSGFIATTPQALANLVLLLLLFLACAGISWSVLLLLAAAALLIHPIAGTAAILFLALLWLTSLHITNRHPCESRGPESATLNWSPASAEMTKAKHYALITLGAIATSLAFPVAFLVAGLLLPQVSVSFAPEQLTHWLASLPIRIYRENRFNLPLDTLYFFNFNLIPFFLFVTASGIAASWRAVARAERAALAAAFALIVNGVVLNGFVAFDFLVSTEQTTYGNRLFALAALFLLPFFLRGAAWWGKCLWFRSRALRISLVFTGALLMTASFFSLYPQDVDRYAVSHAWSTSAADIAAVRAIENDANGASYVVLANQAVSAATVREFGFRDYYQPDCSLLPSPCPESPLFFYPIPTRSPLHDLYLDMVYKEPSRETMERARAMMGVDRVYFVLNRYWTDFEKIKASAAKNLHPVLDDNELLIFSL